MKAAELYKILDAQLGAWFEKEGFQRLRKGQLGYEKTVDGRPLAVSFQCDQWGWDAHSGSSFFVNFRVGAADDVARREERLNSFLTDEELQEARDLHDQVVARIPKPPREYWDQMTAAFARHSRDAAGLVNALRARFEPEPLPYRRHQDFALRYWQEADVVGWARLLLRVLPRATAEMAGWTGREPR